MDDAQIDAYLARIRAPRPTVADDRALRELQWRHLLAVPFENLSIHRGEEIELEYDALVDKVVRRRRGGFCYELNGAFAALLRALGFSVDLLNGRVHADGVPGPPYDHLALRVRTADGGGPWLADVGFGAQSRRPLRLDSRADQPDPVGVFRLVETDEGDLDLLRDGRPLYRMEARARALADFRTTCWYHQTSPASPFTRSLVTSRDTERGKITLSGRKLVVTEDGERRTEELADEPAVLDAYRRHFGIALDREPQPRLPAGSDGYSAASSVSSQPSRDSASAASSAGS